MQLIEGYDKWLEQIEVLCPATTLPARLEQVGDLLRTDPQFEQWLDHPNSGQFSFMLAHACHVLGVSVE